MPSGAIPYPFGDCRVCGDHATGVHYGVATCEGCKGFYKRSLAKAYKYRCFHGGKCSISPMERNRCKSCRYQRCVMVGMSVDGVKMGRIPKVDKERALEEHYGCGSREIISSGLVLPQPNKRHGKDPSKFSGSSGGMANGETMDLSAMEDSDLPGGAVGGGGRHFNDESLQAAMYQQTFLSDSYVRRRDSGSDSRRHNDDCSDLHDDRDRMGMETRIKLENIDAITSAELQRQIGLSMNMSYQPESLGASTKNSASVYVHSRDSRHSSEGIAGREPHDSQYIYTAADGVKNMAASRQAFPRAGHRIDEDGTHPRYSDLRRELNLGNHRGADRDEDRYIDQIGNMKRRSVNDDGDNNMMNWNNGRVYAVGGSAIDGRQCTRVTQPITTNYSPSLPPHRGRADQMTYGSVPMVSGRRSAGDEVCRESGKGMGSDTMGRPRSNDNGLSPFYPPVIKELIAQVIDSGKDTRELKQTLVKQLMSTTNSHPLSSSSAPSPSSSILSHHPYSASSLSPASSASVQSAGSAGLTGGSTGVNWSGTSSSGRSPIPQSTVGSEFGDDSKLTDPGMGDYEEDGESGDGFQGCSDMDWTTSENCQWRSQPRKRVLNDEDLSEDADEDSNGESVPLKRSHSASELCSNNDVLTGATAHQKSKDSSVERDISEYINDSLSLSGNSDRVSFSEMMKRQRQQMKVWPEYEPTNQNGKKYELEHMMVEAGQRGKLRDAIDRICEEMSFGDVPILNLDSNSITVNGETQYRADVEPSQSGIQADLYGSIQMSGENSLDDKSGKTSLQDIQVKEEMAGTDEDNYRCESPKAKTFHDNAESQFAYNPSVENISQDVDDKLSANITDPDAKQSDKALHIDGSRNQARLCLKQGYITQADTNSQRNSNSPTGSTTAIVKYDPEKVVTSAGEEGDSERRSHLMRRVLHCIKVFADKVMHLVEIEIGIAVDEATGRRPIHKLNDPATVITQEEVCVFWNDFMLTLPRANTVIMGLCANIPGFKQLNVSDQLTLIEQAYYMLWMILYNRLFWDGDCHIRINCEAMYSRSWFNRFFPESLVASMFSFAEELNRCQLTPSEIMLLCALQLTNVDGAKLENPWRVQRLHDYYLDLLAYEIEQSHVTNHSKILIKIFQLLPLLAPMNQQQLEVVDTFSVDQPPTSTS